MEVAIPMVEVVPVDSPCEYGSATLAFTDAVLEGKLQRPVSQMLASAPST